MSLMPSLCAALERVGGERLVMRAGERPHVLAGDRRHDVASAILSVNAVEALAEQILSSDGRRELREKGTASETIQAASFPHPLMAKAERVGDEFSIELVVQKPLRRLRLPSPSLLSLRLRRSNPSQNQSRSRLLPPPPPVVEHSYSEPAPVHVEAPPPVAHTEPVSASSSDRRHTRRRSSSGGHAMRTLSSPASGERLDLQGWIAYAIGRGATTLYLRAGAPASSTHRRSH